MRWLAAVAVGVHHHLPSSGIAHIISLELKSTPPRSEEADRTRTRFLCPSQDASRNQERDPKGRPLQSSPLAA